MGCWGVVGMGLEFGGSMWGFLGSNRGSEGTVEFKILGFGAGRLRQ